MNTCSYVYVKTFENMYFQKFVLENGSFIRTTVRWQNAQKQGSNFVESHNRHMGSDMVFYI